MMRRWIVLAFGYGFLVACGAIASDDAGSADEILLTTGESLVDPARLRERADDVLREFRESEAAVQECMAARGYAYPPRTIEITYLLDSRRLYTRLERAELFGYGISENEGSSGISVAIRWNGGSAVQLDELNDAVESSSCSELRYERDPQREIVDSFDAWGVEVDQELLARPGVPEAVAAWQECMHEAGYDYGSRAEAVQSLADELLSTGDSWDADDQEHFRQREIAIATRDAECDAIHVAPVVGPLLGSP